MLQEQLSRCESAFRSALLTNPSKERVKYRHLLEGAVSDAWQSYCCFSRNVAIYSSLGCTTAAGTVHPASIAPASWQRASYVAIRGAKGEPVQPSKTNGHLWKEPTWGDSAKAPGIIAALNPGNAGTLVGHLAGGLLGPKHCQIVRNACAHKNHQTKAAVEALSLHYIASRIIVPTDALIWRDPVTQEFAFISWLEDMRTIAEGAIQ